eukprot:5623661-Pyramimonas_sp.AAC.1
MDVLVGYALSYDGLTALRRATEGVGVGIAPESAGAPPATETAAQEVGRPMDVEVVPGPPRAPPPPLEDGPGAADPPRGDDSDPPLDNDAEGQEHQLVDAKT